MIFNYEFLKAAFMMHHLATAHYHTADSVVDRKVCSNSSVYVFTHSVKITTIVVFTAYNMHPIQLKSGLRLNYYCILTICGITLYAKEYLISICRKKASSAWWKFLFPIVWKLCVSKIDTVCVKYFVRKIIFCRDRLELFSYNRPIDKICSPVKP